MRKGVSVLLTVLLTLLPAVPMHSASALGMVQGTVSLEGRPIAGVEVVFVESGTGAVHRVRSSAAGAFQTQLAPGRYLVTTENTQGLVVAQAPTLVPIVAGRVASANIDLLALAVPIPQEAPAQDPTAGALGQGTLTMEPEATCFVAGEFPLLSANVMPTDKVARVRVYFKSALGDAYYYVEAGPQAALWDGKLPRPKVEASPIRYYWQATFTDFGEVTGKEVEAIVVNSADECEDKVVAPFGPAGPVQVFSAATGGAIAPAGFAAGALGAGAIIAIVAGAVGAGIVGGIVVNNPTPTPTPSARPSPPVPTPTPTPTPSPSPTVVPPPITVPPPVSPSCPCP